MVSYNGKLYFFGGYGASAGSVTDFWEYDPVTKKLTEQNSLSALAQNPWDGAAVVVGDKMYFIYSGQLFEYNFTSKVWTQKAGFPGGANVNRQNLTAIGNTLYLSNSGTNSFYSYDTTNNTWLQKANYPGAASGGGFSFSIGTKVYKGGGQNNSAVYLNSFYEYDPATDTWATKASLPAAIAVPTAVSSNGKGYVGAGIQVVGSASVATGNWYEYTPGTNTWATKATGPLVQTSTGAVIDNTVFLFSGANTGNQITTSFISRYTPSDNIWKTDSAYAGGNRMYASGFHYNGKIYLAGGDDAQQRIDTWEYTIATNTWARKADMPGTGFSLSGQASVGSKLYVIGGMKRALGQTYSNALLQYDAITNVWETKAPYPGGSFAEIGAFVINGELYAGGGWSGSPNISSNLFYRYNSQSNTWTQLTSAPNNGSVNGSFAIGDTGYFLFAGSGTTAGSLYAYNSLTNTWTQKQSLPDYGLSGGSQGGTGNIVAKDGNAYIVGVTGGSYSMVRKYDPLTDKWTSLFRAPFFKKGQTLVTAADDIYVGMGYGVIPNANYYHIENDWYRLNLQVDVSTHVGDINFTCAGSESMAAGESRTFTDAEGKLFIAAQAGSSVSSNLCINQRSLSSSDAFRFGEIAVSGVKYTAMFANKNFTVTSGGIVQGATLKMYFTTAELTAFVNSFNSKYGSNKTISDIRFATTSGGGTLDLDPLNNTDFISFYTPSVSDYKSTNKILSYTPASGTGEGFVTEVYLVLALPAQILSFPAITAKVYGTADFAPGVSSTNSTIAITYTSSNSGVATITTDGKIHITGVGTTTITASQAGNASYTAATPVAQELTVTPAALTIKADNSTKIYGAANPAFTVTYTGLVNGDNAASLTTAPTLTTTATAASPVNTYAISASGAASANYIITYTAGTLTISKAPLTVTADNKTRVEGVANPAFTASYSGFANSETSSVLSTAPSFTTTASSSSPPGTYPINPAGAVSPNYTITYVPGTLTVTPSPPVISSFTPTTSVAGATVTISGNYFTGATAVSFGGVPAASFTVTSSSSITAVVGAGASGNVSVTTSLGTHTLAGYIFVPKPVITAASQTTFASGGSVVLSAAPGSGFTYKWARNGSDIAGATAASYTATESGAYTVTITSGPVSTTSDAITVNMVFTLPATNFKLTATGETCRTSNNGQLNITAVQNRAYTAVLTGNSVNLSKPFTTSVDFTDLQAGTYNVCITVTGQTSYKQCFDVVITEPKDLSLFTTIQSGNKLALTLEGSSIYNVELNGASFRTSSKNFTLDLRPGENTLKISSDKSCQGIIEKHFNVNETPVVYPNPFDGVLNISDLPGAQADIEIRSLDGLIVFKQSSPTENGRISLSLPNLAQGLYVLKATSANKVYIYRIVKK